MECLTTFASILDEFFKYLSDCGLMTCYSVQLQSNVTGVDAITKFKTIIQDLIKKLESLLVSIPSVQSSEASTQTMEEASELVVTCHSISLASLSVPALSSNSSPMASDFRVEDQVDKQQRQKIQGNNNVKTVMTANKQPQSAIICELRPLIIETNKTFPQLMRIQPSSQQEVDKVKVENIVQIVVETPCNPLTLKDYSDNADSEESLSTSPGEQPFSGCNEKFGTQQEKKEQTTSNQNVQYHVQTCDMCDKVFNCIQSLQEHCRKDHNGVGCFKCSLCDKRFMTKLSYNRHMDTHEGKKDAICDLCGKGFSRADYLQTHYSIHLGKRNYACSQCPRKFVRKMHLKAHEKIHSGVKDHVCKICNKGFARSDKLKEHMMRHWNIKRFQCPVCQRDYTEKRDLKVHLISHSK